MLGRLKWVNICNVLPNILWSINTTYDDNDLDYEIGELINYTLIFDVYDGELINYMLIFIFLIFCTEFRLIFGQ